VNGARRVIVPLEIAPAAPAFGAAVHTLQGQTMGTTWCVKLCGPRLIDAVALQRAIQQPLDGVVAQMSPWEAGSPLSRFNRAPPGSWHTLPADLLQVLACALQVAASSEGAFDPAAGELVNLWGFGPPGPVAAPPLPAELAAARARGDWRQLVVRDIHVRQPGGLQLDLSAIAKGFGVDQVSRRLHQLGIADHLVEVGGELRGSGVRPDGQPWWVDLQVPPSAGGAITATRVALHGLSVATSGDYLRCFDDGGVRRSHTIDPRTGWPVAHGLASVSVLHAECMHADALSTALTVLGPQHGMQFARRHGIAALFVERRGDVLLERLSPALEAMAL
jgi:thiamine biosynthesis lipoprotein